jgi:ribosomal protein S18 acetylase RimI-like enzyme
MPALIRRATGQDLPEILALLDLYYNEWDIWQRDSSTTIRNLLRHPGLGFFLAEVDNLPAGCVLCRPLPHIENAAECKRLYVAPGFRGHHLADLLMQELESAAKREGKHWVYLDSKPEFSTAIALYRRRGYVDTPRYNDNAQATVFLRKNLIARTIHAPTSSQLHPHE